jgi:hypothetical protein
MGILNIFIDASSRPNESKGDFLDLAGNRPRSKRIRITPISYLYGVFLIRAFRKKSALSHENIQVLSKGANVRCLDCGWKYNFQSTTQCPICTSEQTYLLSNGTFLASVLTISFVLTLSCGALALAYNSITS